MSTKLASTAFQQQQRLQQERNALIEDFIKNDIFHLYGWLYLGQKESFCFTPTAKRFNISPDTMIERDMRHPYEILERIDITHYVDELHTYALSIGFSSLGNDFQLYRCAIDHLAKMANSTYVADNMADVDASKYSSITELKSLYKDCVDKDAVIYMSNVFRTIISPDDIGMKWHEGFAYDRHKDTGCLSLEERHLRELEDDEYMMMEDDIEPEYIGRHRR